ncbi:MAG: leucine-rich repeat protein [Clostridia bacterium]|nr:leucine-rich repeat protein [Clostridia bacterium]
MKRQLVILLAAMGLMLLCCAFASAETLGGHMPDVVLSPEDLLTPRGSSITISGVRSVKAGSSATFTATGRSNIRMAVMGVGSTDPLTLYYEYIAYGNKMTFTFYEPGNYYIYAWDANESTINSGWSFRVSVTGISILSQRVRTIVSQCNAAADTAYEKALWMHDYLTKHACFDMNMNQYGAGGVLIEGYGVCDSYSRAYELLMNSMGIDCMRQSGGNHSWNAVRMDDGQWYWVDCTWDDPASDSMVADSGNETHRNFGLSDDLLAFMGHTWNNAVTTCTHLEYNYYVMSGETDPWHAAVLESVMNCVRRGQTTFSVALNGRYELPSGHYDMVKLGWAEFYYTISAYLLDGMQIEMNGSTVTLRAVYDPSNRLVMNFFVQGRLSNVLNIPSELKTIESEAFCGLPMEMVVIPGNCTYIGSRAFADCPNLLMVKVSVNCEIAPDAFEGCQKDLEIVFWEE